ncbi:MAG: Pleiotropic regulatory protein [Parcubacteria group bacterium Gr01-1014_31]|nr:MAG: Pleiotropic regulatory protein [Parcubacteria group bacterium Gr01-1014_31]
MSNMIAIALGPNYQSDDVALSLRLLFQPWKWVRGNSVVELEQAFAREMSLQNAVAFGTGRAALAACLSVRGISTGDEVLLQAFTCVAVPNAVRSVGAVPVFVDIDVSTYTMDPQALAARCTSKTRAIVVQHTFGYPADMDAIMEFARARGLFVIEDCAHAMGSAYRGRPVGALGDVAVFSFGRDKPLSPVFGGMAVAQDSAFVEKLRHYRDERLSPAPAVWVAQQLLHAPLTAAAGVAHRWRTFGKVFLFLVKRLRLVALAVAPEERRGRVARFGHYRMANALAVLALWQLQKIKSFSDHRRAIAGYYRQMLAGTGAELPPPDGEERSVAWLRFPLRVRDPKRVMTIARAANIYLGDWYRPVVAPSGVVLSAVGYREGSCPRAEHASEMAINLPTHQRVSARDAARIISVITPAL